MGENARRGLIEGRHSLRGGITAVARTVQPRSSLVIFVLIANDAQYATDNIAHGGFVWRGIDELYANLGHPLNQPSGIGLFCELDSTEEKNGGGDGATFGAFDLTSFEETVDESENRRGMHGGERPTKPGIVLKSRGVRSTGVSEMRQSLERQRAQRAPLRPRSARRGAGSSVREEVRV